MKRIVISMAVVVGAGLAAVLPASTASADLSAGSIVCTIQVQNAHPSSHVDGTINVVSTVVCNAIVPRISQTTSLHQVGAFTWKGTNKVGYDAQSVQSNASAGCFNSPGSFYGSAVTDVTWPVGYVGPTHESLTGKKATISCTSAASVPTSASVGNVAAAPIGFSYSITAKHR